MTTMETDVDWISSSLDCESACVTSLVPTGFVSYVRLFHPAKSSKPVMNWEDVVAGRERPWQIVRWREVARAAGTRVSPLMQFRSLLGSSAAGKSTFCDEPALGVLEEDLASAVAELLGRHTRTPTDCFFGVWEGSNSLRPEVVASSPSFELSKDWIYHLLEGPIDKLVAAQPIHLAWPRDRAWFLATHVDFDSSYLGCSAPCMRELLADARFEAFEVKESDPVMAHTDPYNPFQSV